MSAPEHPDRFWTAFRWAGRISAVMVVPFAKLDLPAKPTHLGDQAALMCANHRSLLDLIISYILLTRWQEPTRCLVNARYFETRGLGWLLRVTGCIPVESGWADEAIEAGLAVLAADGNIAIMPEGRLVPPAERIDGIGEVRTGVGRLAGSADVPILVVGVAGSDEVWPRGRAPRPRLRRPTVALRVRLLDPIDGRAEDQRDRIQATMRELVAETEAVAAAAD